MGRADGMDLLYSFENQGQQALNGLSGLQSSWNGVNNAQDVRSKFGIKDNKEMFAPLYKMLDANRGRQMQNAGMQVGRSASPGMTFSNIEQNNESGLNDLMGKQNQADSQQQQFVAQMLGNGMNSKDQFGLSKFNSMGSMASGLMNNRLSLEQFNRQGEGPKPWDIISTVLGQGAKVAGSALGAPGAVPSFKGSSAPIPGDNQWG